MKRIAALLIDDFADWELPFFMAGARAFFGAEVATVSPGGRAVASMGGLRAQPDHDLARFDAAACDALVVAGSPRWATPDAPDIGGPLRQAHAAGRAVGFICGATLAAARAGLLDERAHTSNSLAFLAGNVSAYRGADRYMDVPHAVADRGVVTAPGTAPTTFAVAMFRVLWPEREADIAGYAALCAREHQPA